MTDIILETRGLTKHYGGVHALDDANFSCTRASMSRSWATTARANPPSCARSPGSSSAPAARSSSTGRRCSFKGPLEAREAGIETVFQNLALADDLDVPSNLFLGREMISFNLGPFSILDRKAMRERDAGGAGEDGGEDPQPVDNTDPQHVGRAAAMRGDRADGGLRLQAHHHGRTDGGAGRAGNRAGREHHPHAEGARASR